MPEPKEGETRDKFLERCIPMVIDDGTARDGKQGMAGCVSMWDKAQEGKAADMKAVTKKEADGEHPASHYLVVEDPEKPTTWHLRVKGTDGRPDHRLMGAAWAALHGGYRGNRYEGPGKEEAIRKLRALYEREDMEPPGESALSADEILEKLTELANSHDKVAEEIKRYTSLIGAPAIVQAAQDTEAEPNEPPDSGPDAESLTSEALKSLYKMQAELLLMEVDSG